MTDAHPPARRRKRVEARARRRSSVPSRLILAGVAALLTYLVSAGGLFYHWPAVMEACLVGIVVGLVAGGPLEAAVAAIAGITVGVLAMPGYYMDPRQVIGQPGIESLACAMATIVGAGLAAAAVGWGRAALRSRHRGSPVVRRTDLALVGAAVVMCLVGLWSTVLIVAGQPSLGVAYQGRSLAEHLSAQPTTNVVMSDDDFYRDVVFHMRVLKEPYYKAYRTAHRENKRWGADPSFFLYYRLPTTYWMLAATPGGGMGAIVGMLLFATVGIVASLAIAAHRVRLPLAVVAVAAASSYYLYLCTQLMILYPEPRAVTLSLVSIACMGFAERSPRWRAWTAAAAASALASALFREIAAFVLVAGFVAAFFAPAERRRFRIVAWGLGLAGLAAALVAHLLAVGPHISSIGPGLAGAARPSIENAFVGLRYATRYLGGDGWLPYALALLAVAGIARAPDRSQRAFGLTVIALPLIGFMLFYDGSVTETGARSNYWGTLLEPILYAFVPWAFAYLHGAARPVPLAAPPDAGGEGPEGDGPGPGGVRDDG